MTPSAVPETRLRYVPALDSLRAVAVLAVMATHADLPYVGGGELGVDIFFVLSGFLITTLILSEATLQGRVSWPQFYARRALRLFPAVLLVTAATMVMVLLTAGALTADSYQNIAIGKEPEGGIISNTVRECLAAIFYFANFAGLLGIADVFLGHTWSLAVEEQFYILWPLAFALFVRRLTPNGQVLAVGCACAALAAARVAGLEGPGGILQLRFDVLLVGVTAALALHHHARISRVGRAWPVAALVITYGVVVGPDDGPSGRLLFSAVGLATAVLVLAIWTEQLGAVSRLAHAVPLVKIGQISYGLYLWHLPVFRRVALQDIDLSGPALVALKFGLAFALAIASYVLVERPALRLKRRFQPKPMAAVVRDGVASS